MRGTPQTDSENGFKPVQFRLVERPLKELCRRSPSGGGTQRRVKVVQWPAIEPITSKERYMKYAIAAAAIAAVFAAGPASAAMMSCSGENMTKTSTAMTTMQEGPNKIAMGKAMGIANTEMSKGNMKGA